MQVFPGGIRILSIPVAPGIVLLSSEPKSVLGPEGTSEAGPGIGAALGLIGLGIALVFGFGVPLTESPTPSPGATVTNYSTLAPTSESAQTSTNLDVPSSETQIPLSMKSTTVTPKVKAE